MVSVRALPYDVHRELCRILDNGDDWRELAGGMGYSPFEICEIENVQRTGASPSKLLLERWGQQIHSANELYVLLYKMRHVPALRCLARCVDPKCHRLLRKLEDELSVLDENRNKKQEDSVRSIPLPVREIGQGQDTPERRQQSVSTRKQDDVSYTENTTDTESADFEIADGRCPLSTISIPKIPFSELCLATNQWSKDNVLGSGGFGEVYKGNWKETQVAIKRLKPPQGASSNNGRTKPTQDFLRELSLNSFRIDNIVPLYGISVDPHSGTCLLVYQLMAQGSLESKLRPKTSMEANHTPLTWRQRVKIALGTARGLQFLHSSKKTPLIHGDIKPANILLDQCFEPKIADFGLARMGSNEDSAHMMVSKIQGTRYYIPDDYKYSRQLSPAVDVFSFGVVLIEMATALRVYDRTRGEEGAWLRNYVHNLYEMAENNLDEISPSIEDPSLRQSRPSLSNPQLCTSFIEIGVKCTAKLAINRPDMIEVYHSLKRLNDTY